MTTINVALDLEISDDDVSSFTRERPLSPCPWEGYVGSKLEEAAHLLSILERKFFLYYYKGYKDYEQIAYNLNLGLSEVENLHQKTVSRIAEKVRQSPKVTRGLLSLVKQLCTEVPRKSPT